MLAIETRELTKDFRHVRAVDSLTLNVPVGSAYGFLGPNGSGKTTTIRLLLGLARPTSGEARILGRPAGPGSPAKERVGFLPDVPAFYGWMKAPEYLAFAGDLFGIDRSELRRRTGELLELTGLAGVRTRIGGFSRGMKQRLGLAQAMINRPDLVILDEPTSALDPIGRREVLETVKVLAQSLATTVFFSTHILADVERVCDRVGILHRGRLVADESIKDLKSRYAQYALPAFDVEVVSGAADLARALEGLPWADRVEVDENRLRVLAADAETAQVALPRIIGERGLGLTRFEASEPTLEDVFVRLVSAE